MPPALPIASLPPRFPSARLAASARTLAELAPRLGVALWQAGQLGRSLTPTASTGWPALDAELPGGGWPLAGLSELLAEPASGELSLLAPWLRELTLQTGRELLWVAPPVQPCVAALQGLGLSMPRLVCLTPPSAADAAWAAEQALRAGSCGAVLWWSSQPVTNATLRRLHLAAQTGGTPLLALRPPSAVGQSSPAPLRLACTPRAGRRMAVEVFKRRGPPMAGPLILDLPWPTSARRAASALPPVSPRVRDVVDRPAPASAAVASPALVASRA